MNKILNWFKQGENEINKVTTFQIIGTKAFQVLLKNIPQIIIGLFLLFLFTVAISLPLFIYTFIFLT